MPTPPTAPPRTTWRQALAWRMERHLLEPVGEASVPDVVARLCGVQAQVASTAELAVRVRRETSEAGEVAAALADGRVIKTWAMRGTLHLLTPDAGAPCLALIADAKPWERPVWQRYFGMTNDSLALLRAAVREILDGKVLTREELIDAVVARPGLGHVGENLRSGWGTLLKPLAWQGDLCFGPNRGTPVTFQSPEAASRKWAGLPAPEEAARRAITAYFGAYGPATPQAFSMWLAGGWFARERIHALFDGFGDGLVEVDVDGDRAFVLKGDVDAMPSARPTDAVRLLPGFDQWVLGPGTQDGRVLAAARRRDVSRQSGWIAPIVVAGGVVAGTWELDGGVARVAWFREAGKIPRKALKSEAERLAGIVGRELRLEVRSA